METREDILKELSELSPKLAGLQKRNPFAVPNNYFNQFDGNILAVIKGESVETELGDALVLKSLHSKENPFDVPFGYFEKLPEKILERVSSKEKRTVVRSIREYFQYSFRASDMLAALPVAAILIIAILLFRPQSVTTSSSGNAVALSSEEIQDYLGANVSSLDEGSIAEQIAEGALSGQADINLDENDPSLIDLSTIDLSTIQNL